MSNKRHIFVKINQYSLETYWYSDQVENIFEVDYPPMEMNGTFSYELSDESSRWINSKDCTEVDEFEYCQQFEEIE